MTKLVMGEIVCIGPDDEEGIPYDDAVIHIEGDEDSEIRVNCPGALRLAPKIVAAVNNYDALVKHLHHLATVCCDEDALKLLDTLDAALSHPSRGTASE